MRESRETHTPDSLALLLEQLKGIVASVETSRMWLETANVARVETQRASSRVRGTTELQGFADALRDAARAVAMAALQNRAPELSALSVATQNDVIHADSRAQKDTKRKASDKPAAVHKAR